ncbi:hypothetical protein [Microbacterium sp. Se5.02b]|uniref:hypothetical protein n=1 Tax=Microbacterium sp. Se5.02b TaxID=2864103 RepID=UPI001C6930C9|nr:hypothetical protein [Microbacterium sp. Se5.02b]QYM64542.1 hypothetical protein K1X59_01060 [Microbacterium sp. Se5.02b]
MADTLTLALRSARPRRRLALASWIPLALLAVIVLACVLAPVIAPFDPSAQSPDRFAGPSAVHLFGTDELGRDLFSRVLYGGQLTIFIAGGATLVAMVLGIAWGWRRPSPAASSTRS